MMGAPWIRLAFFRLLMVVAGDALLWSPQESQAALLGRWTFEEGSLADSTGNFGPLMLHGNASIANGELLVHSDGTYGWQIPAGWASTTGYSGPAIADKTLVSWVTLSDIDQQGMGAAIAIVRNGREVFDAIVFEDQHQHLADLSKHQWQATSEGNRRWQKFEPGYRETASGEQLLLAVTYGLQGNGNVTIRGYRNGVQLGEYTTGNAASWQPGDAVVLFGPRHLTPDPEAGLRPVGGLNAKIAEARIYDTALPPEEILKLSTKASRSLVEWTAAGQVVDVLAYPQGPSGLKCFSRLGESASVRATLQEDRFSGFSDATGWLEGAFSDDLLANTYLSTVAVADAPSEGTTSYVTSDRFRIAPLVIAGSPNSIELARGSVSDGVFRSEWSDNQGCRYSVVGQETSRRPLKVGDVTGDQLFDSGDLVQTFASGKYETGLPANWYEGDWTFDNRFDTTDLIEAFKQGTYEKPSAGVAAVPEPSSWGLFALGGFAIRSLGTRRLRL